MEALGAFLITILPYLTPLVIVFITFLANKLTSSIAANQQASAAAKAMVTFTVKASKVVAAIEQTQRKAFGDACADGKITGDEAKQLAQLALATLLDQAKPELTAMGVTDPTTQESIARATLETEVFRLPKSNRVPGGVERAALGIVPGSAPIETLK
jgi:hypothetical protein